MDFKEGDDVILLRNITADNGEIFKSGDDGMIIEVLSHDTFLVEFVSNRVETWTTSPSFSIAQLSSSDFVVV